MATKHRGPSPLLPSPTDLQACLLTVSLTLQAMSRLSRLSSSSSSMGSSGNGQALQQASSVMQS